MAATEMVLFESSDGVVTLPVEVDATNEDAWLTHHQLSIRTIGTEASVPIALQSPFGCSAEL